MRQLDAVPCPAERGGPGEATGGESVSPPRVSEPSERERYGLGALDNVGEGAPGSRGFRFDAVLSEGDVIRAIRETAAQVGAASVYGGCAAVYGGDAGIHGGIGVCVCFVLGAIYGGSPDVFDGILQYWELGVDEKAVQLGVWRGDVAG